MCSNSVSCPLCFQSTFPNIDTLRNSLIKAANGPILCPICNETLLGLDKLTIHLFSHTNLLISTASEVIPCISNSTVSQSSCTCPDDSNDSVKIKTEFPSVDNNVPEKNDSTSATTSDSVQDACVSQLKCDICGLSFRTGELLNMHNMLIHRASNDIIGTNLSDVRYQCHLCAKVFKMKGSLRVHLKVVHTIGLQVKKENLKLNICQKMANRAINAVTATTSTSKTAPSSMELLSSNSNSRRNSSSPDSTKTSVAESPKINGVATSNRAPEAPKIWECDICSKSFTTKYFLKKHKRLHTGEMPYTCNICGKTFTFQQSYHKHLLYHSDEKPHVCQTCGRAFKELSTLHNHERIHSGEKPFKCETCGKCFRQRVSYLVHKRIHTGAMPYKCTACEKSFRYKVSQRTHKCSAQPPGMVVRQGGDLLEKLLHTSSTDSSKSSDDCGLPDLIQKHDIPLVTHVDPVHIETHDEELLMKSIDEIVSESCFKMGIESVREAEENYKLSNKDIFAHGNEQRTPSPTDKLENLCLYSPTDSSFVSPLDAIYAEALKTILNETT